MSVKVWNYGCTDVACSEYNNPIEKFIKGEPPEHRDHCHKCKTPLKQMLTNPRFKLEGISGDFPSAADKWADQHEQAARLAAKKNRDRNIFETEKGER